MASGIKLFANGLRYAVVADLSNQYKLKYEDKIMNTESKKRQGNEANTLLSAAFTMYLNEDANGMIYVSKTPMNQTYYFTPARLKCIETKAKKVTRKGVFAGAICETIDGRILEVVKVKNRQGYERKYIREGSL